MIEVRTSEEVSQTLNNMEIPPYKWRIFLALQRNPQVYAGTVTRKVKAKRRAANKRQRAARKATRHGN